jgi:hypothetical protein
MKFAKELERDAVPGTLEQMTVMLCERASFAVRQRPRTVARTMVDPG